MNDHGQEENANGGKISQLLFGQRSISQNSWRLFHGRWENVVRIDDSVENL